MVNDNQSNLDQEVVFSRLLDGRGRAADWQRLREATAADASAWDRLIGSAGDQDVLGDVVGLAGERADACDADTSTPPAPLAFPSAQGRRADRAVRAARLGWLVAACMALGMVSVYMRPAAPSSGMQGANLAPFSLDNYSSNDLMNKYKDRASKEGTLVGELPQRLVLETRPSSDGKGYEVLYMRQFIERVVVDDMYKFATDDVGRPVMVPGSLQKEKPAGAM
jgi:hypothetical protein